jgi:phage repressor protein C with HTH and peptisase S24 domain
VEFDWLGVLIGPDLRFEHGRVVGDPDKRARTDGSLKGWKKSLQEAKGDVAATEAVLAKVQAIIKNTYKVLLSRGRKGCFVWCADRGLREYLRDRLQLASRTFATQAATPPPAPPAPEPRIVASPPGKRFTDWVPVYDLNAAAGDFGPSSPADCLGWIESPPDILTYERHFAARVHGRSMEPLIPDGSLCLFRFDVAGSRGGRILLVQHHAISDPELGGSYTVKKYRSLKVQEADADKDTWSHTAIQLVPLNAEFKTIWINPDQVDDLRVVAEFIRVLP